MIRIAVGSSTVSLKKLIQRFARDPCVALSHGSTRLDRVGPDWTSLDPGAGISGRKLIDASEGVDRSTESPLAMPNSRASLPDSTCRFLPLVCRQYGTYIRWQR